jgi:hypothetical protein
MLNPADLSYPPPDSTEDEGTGLFPVDFLIEDALRLGFDWFKTDPKAPAAVFSHLTTSFLSQKYGIAKVNEIAAFIKKYEIRIVQHFTLIDEQLPCISIQLLDAGEMPERAGFDDFAGTVDVMNGQNEIIGRNELKYSPVQDSVHIGIHCSNTPDLCKYLYYLVVYILVLFKPEFMKRGMQLSTFRATDLSKLNEYLPSNVYSRFINFSTFSIAKVDAGLLPMIMNLNVQVGGIEVPTDTGEDDGVITNIDLGIGLVDIQENENGKE